MSSNKSGVHPKNTEGEKMIRQKRYECGAYMDIEIFYISDRMKEIKRERKEKESSPAQKQLNDKKAKRYLTRMVHLNFSEGDLYVDLTFDNENLPKDRKGVQKEIRNYIARLKRHRKKNGLPELKYVYVISDVDQDGNKARYHAHMIINGMDRDVAEEKWGKGYANADRLQFNEAGVTGKVLYIARQGKGEKTWSGSANLKKPEPKVTDRKIKPRHMERMKNDPEDREFFERLYPGWTFTDCVIEDSQDRVNGTGVYIRMRKHEKFKKSA
ncbi:MAG: hypothetical protein HFE75_11570 [Firmicutes bacterium]|nr:hypothetical protein [Bacillota bacterium]